MTKLTDDDIKSMIDDCMNVLTIPKQNGGPGFNSWEQEFVIGIEMKFKKVTLSDRQIDKLEQIWNKI